jgi:hypothetical protein
LEMGGILHSGKPSGFMEHLLRSWFLTYFRYPDAKEEWWLQSFEIITV